MRDFALNQSPIKRRDGEGGTSAKGSPVGRRRNSVTLEFPNSPTEASPPRGENAPPQGASSGSGAEDAHSADEVSGRASAANDSAAAQAASKSKRRRQGPMSAACFIKTEAGEPRDGLLKMYCSINAKNECLKLFRFLQNDEARQGQLKRARAEVEAAKASLAAHRRRPLPQESSAAAARRQEVLQASASLRAQRRHCLRLAAAERLELRDDLNLLLSSLREGLVECYPTNEHMLGIARRVERISTGPLLWARQRPLLLKRHKEGFFEQWRKAGAPEDPLQVLGEPCPGDAAATPGTAGTPAPGVEEPGENASSRADPQHVEEGRATQAAPEGVSQGPDFGRSVAETSRAAGAAAGPSEEELEELRRKRLEALERKARLARQREAACGAVAP